MLYERTFRFAASHYGPWHHGIVWAAKQNGSISWEALKELMSKLHGHNFAVEVSFAYDEATNVYGVWDQDIETTVMEWANCNISMHQDFFQKDWTSSTENMALVLANKLLNSFPKHVDEVTVTVRETEDIKASTTAYRA